MKLDERSTVLDQTAIKLLIAIVSTQNLGVLKAQQLPF